MFNYTNVGREKKKRLIGCMEVARHWRLRAQRLRMAGDVCQKGHINFPPRDICGICGEESKIPIQYANAISMLGMAEKKPAEFVNQVVETV